MVDVRIESRTILWIVGGGTVVVWALNAVHQIAWFRFGTSFRDLGWKLDLQSDESLGAWFAGATLLLAAGLLWLAGRRAHERGIGHVGAWRFLSLVFVVLSIDEVATLHEWSGGLVDVPEAGGFLHYGWVVIGIAFVVVVGLMTIGLVRSLPAIVRGMFLGAGAVFVGGALGLEMINAREDAAGGAGTATYALGTAVEEGFEMAGVFIVTWALLRLLDDPSWCPAPAPEAGSTQGRPDPVESRA